MNERKKPMFLLSLLTNKDSYNTQITQHVNDNIQKTVSGTRFWNRFWNFRTGPWNRFLRQSTTCQQKFTQFKNQDKLRLP